MFKSVTLWQGDFDWLIDVIVDDFETVEAAAIFGRDTIARLIKYPEADYLTLILKDGQITNVFGDALKVRKLKSECYGNPITDDRDYFDVDLKVQDFDTTDGLNRGFGSLSYGVLDENNNPIDISTPNNENA